ncbi:MAG: hydrogenase maturation peptidase HycI [Methanobacteriaceae archaeon]|nr:hydrogenase maturation peptidase HycI [Methanobacteriaceae archaeon]
MGVGNELKADDGLGPYFIQILSQDLKDKPQITLINAGSVPENFTGKIRKENPTHIILIDAVLMEEAPGYTRLIKKEEIKNMGISTHSMPLSYLINYLELEKTYNICFIGIQPADLSLKLELTPEVKESTEELKNNILKLL